VIEITNGQAIAALVILLTTGYLVGLTTGWLVGQRLQ